MWCWIEIGYVGTETNDDNDANFYYDNTLNVMENLLDHANDTEGTMRVKMIEMDVKRRNIPISYCQKLSATRNGTCPTILFSLSQSNKKTT